MLDSIPLFPGLPGGPELLIVLLIVKPKGLFGEAMEGEE